MGSLSRTIITDIVDFETKEVTVVLNFVFVLLVFFFNAGPSN